MSYSSKVYRKQGGNELVISSGGQITLPVQQLAKTETATSVTNFGITQVAATSTAPTYTLAAPFAGAVKDICAEKSSSGAGYTAVLQTNSTGVAFDSTGSNKLTLGTTTTLNVHLVALSTVEWRVTGGEAAITGAGTQST